MDYVTVKSLNNFKVIADKCLVGNSMWARFKGLLGRTVLNPGEAIWLKPCNGIHTFFMNFSIDVVYVDRELKVVSLYSSLSPWKFHLPHWKAKSVFEFRSGTITMCDLKIGDKLCIDSLSSPETRRGQV